MTGGGAKKGGLAFLNKKQWHTGHIRNIEKVWIAEQKAQKEQDRVKELQKQLTEERSVEAIRKLQKESGLIAQGAGDRLDWMYQMGTVGPSAEEYLLGKEFKNDIAKEEIKQVESKPGSLFLQTNVNQELEAENRLREDPLLALLKEDKLRKENILKNPVKMEEIRKAALLTKLVSATKKRHKREKKKKKKGSDKSDDDSDDGGSSKKAKKEKKHKKMDPEHKESKQASATAPTPVSTTQVKKEPIDASDSSSHRRRKSKSKSRSKSRDKEGRDKGTTNGHGGSNPDKDNHSRSRKSRSRSRSRSRGRRDHKGGRGDSDRRRSKSPPPHRRSRSRSRSKTRKHDSDKDKNTDTHATSSKEETDREREAAKERMKAVPALSKSSIGQYGLITKQTADPERDRERQREREAAENKRQQEREEKEKQRYHRKPAGSHTKQMSAEEKAQKLAEMMADGEKHDAAAVARYAQHQAKEKQEEQAYFQREEHAEKKASFISSMNKDVYSGKESVEDRLKKYSQYRQKGATEDHSFMKRD